MMLQEEVGRWVRFASLVEVAPQRRQLVMSALVSSEVSGDSNADWMSRGVL